MTVKREPGLKAVTKAERASLLTQKRAKRKVGIVELQRLIFCNSDKLPQTVDDDGVRKRWVGIGWVNEGNADGTEEARVVR